MNKIKVCKFGGSSVANAIQIQKVADIVKSDSERRIVVVSAPKGVTDLLIQCTNKFQAEKIFPQKEFSQIKERYDEIGTGLFIQQQIAEVLEELRDRITKSRIIRNSMSKKEYEDYVKSWGEYSSAKIIAAFFNRIKIAACFERPEDVGFYVTEDFGNARLLTDSYQDLKKAIIKKCDEKIIVFPGFYGITKNKTYATFSRGGSDLTGAILAAAVQAKVYENWTDQDGIRNADPRIVLNPEKIEEITYKEIRELSYMGFKVFHPEAMIPAMKENIPINVRNTNNPENKGTMIVNARTINKKNPVIGIASRNNFAVFNVEKILMDQEIGFGRKLLGIFEEKGLAYEHAPSGIDSISVILDAEHLTVEIKEKIIKEITKNLHPENVSFASDKSLICVVGIELNKNPKTIARIINAVAKADIIIEILNQGASEISMIIGIKEKDASIAVNAIYQEFFKK